jgi:RNA polymerase sigma factor (sigma-70 family)
MNHQDFSNYLISGSKSELDKAFFIFDKTMRIPFQYWSYFHYWFKSIDDSDIADVYQESLIVFYNRINNTGTEGINTSLKSFFYGIARNKWREYFRKRECKEELSDVFGFVDQIEDKQEQEILFNAVEVYFEQLPKPCQDILRFTFHQDMDCKEIGSIIPNLSIENCRQKRFVCLQKMRKEMGIKKAKS